MVLVNVTTVGWGRHVMNTVQIISMVKIVLFHVPVWIYFHVITSMDHVNAGKDIKGQIVIFHARLVDMVEVALVSVLVSMVHVIVRMDIAIVTLGGLENIVINNVQITHLEKAVILHVTVQNQDVIP